MSRDANLAGGGDSARGATLVTGGGGFVAGHLIALLQAERNGPLVALLRPQDPEGRVPSGARTVVADLTDRAMTQQVLEQIRPSRIYHLAAQSSVADSRVDPLGTLFNNIGAQVNLLEITLELGLRPRILIVGSNEEYGRVSADEVPVQEGAELRPLNAYAVSKATQDLLGYQYHQSYGLPIVRVRPSAHTGPGQSARFVTASFARQIARIEAGLQPPVLSVGNLTARRDFTDVRDVVRAYRLALDQGEAGEVYNVGSERAVSIEALLEALLRQSVCKIDIQVDPTRLRPAEAGIQLSDCEKLRSRTGWRPLIPLEQTLADVLDDWRGRVARDGAAC
jgi:GDP-4-dehydro-6-deoxy-D-mannose reductase